MVTTRQGGPTETRLPVRRVVEELGFGAAVLGDCATELVRGLRGRGALRLRAVVADVIETGVRPLGTISFLAFAVGLILAVSTSWVPEWLAVPLHIDALSMRFIGVAVVREFTPLLLGLFVASRFGVALTARLGTMTLTQAVDALVVMGISPVGFVVLPALLAMLFTVLMLTVWCNVVTFAGIAAWFYWESWISPWLSATYLTDRVDASALFVGSGKAVAFAVLILLIAVVNGSSPDPESAGGASHAIGRAAMATAVQSLVAIIVVALLFAVW